MQSPKSIMMACHPAFFTYQESMSDIHILLPVHNRREITLRFINCLKRQTCRNFELLLIDDGSTDGTSDIVRMSLPNVTILQGSGNWWWAGSLQKGYELLKKRSTPLSDVVLIINDDTIFEDDFLENGLSLLLKHQSSLLLAWCYKEQTQELDDAGLSIDWFRLSFIQAKTMEQIDCFSTRGLFFRMEDFIKIGGFYPKFLPHYLSDYEFTIRAKRKGMKMITDPSVKLWTSDQATGFRVLKKEPFTVFLGKFFSKRSAMNPMAWTAFVMLAAPWYWKPFNILLVWLLALRTIFRALVKSKR